MMTLVLPLKGIQWKSAQSFDQHAPELCGHSIENLRQINKKLNHHFWFISLKTGSVEAFRFEDHDDYEHEISHFITHFIIIIIINKLHLHTESISARK